MQKIQLCITEINYNLKYVQIEIVILNYKNISQYHCFFYKINAALVSIRDYFLKQ